MGWRNGRWGQEEGQWAGILTGIERAFGEDEFIEFALEAWTGV
jgi:hypothetical protein